MSSDIPSENISTSGLNDSGKPTVSQTRVFLPIRPPLLRDQSLPKSQQKVSYVPPVATVPPQQQQQQKQNGDVSNTEDSLSLGQLKKLVSEMPASETVSYAFQYADAASLKEELEEWFTYIHEDQSMILTIFTSFSKSWETFNDDIDGREDIYERGHINWLDAIDSRKKDFIRLTYIGLKSENLAERIDHLEALTYLALGCWYETAGLASEKPQESSSDNVAVPRGFPNDSSDAQSISQLRCTKLNIELLVRVGGLQNVLDILYRICQRKSVPPDSMDDMAHVDTELTNRLQWCSMTILYISLLFATVKNEVAVEQLSKTLEDLKPNLLLFLSELVSRFRWDESLDLPLSKVLLLLWKAVLMQFGGLGDVERVKIHLRDDLREQRNDGHHQLTASPLEYHVFRQEISSKYPAYNPPPPLLPLEPDSNSILPPLYKASRQPSHSSGLGNLNGDGTSILHQPVHIATPAPSPPPSPAGPGGKGGKKQNYQTNQLFPFLYPPLDESSNNLGGKGTTNLQDSLTARKWEGSDIPSSILEAAELFAKRMRVTRPLKQLWAERINYMKFERGWDGTLEDDSETDLLRESTQQDRGATMTDGMPIHQDAMERLNAVESFYKNSLPYMQSTVIVLLKVILSNVTASMAQGSMSGNTQNNCHVQESQATGNFESFEGESSAEPIQNNYPQMSVEAADSSRTQEIMAKSVSGTLILLIKWFKVSHILKFEYITQLLLDSNYIPLILKMLQTQELERAVSFKCDKEELSIFGFCFAHSKNGRKMNLGSQNAIQSDDEDDAAPPPVIKRQRNVREEYERDQPPSVDELGVPNCNVPLEPITSFNWRIFFSSINFLRILQKICKNKGHRNLLLVQYKSSQYLKKALKVPQTDLRLYTLKLFKNQVPYCGRKWRQSNMRVITAVYLHCRPELRDDWLAGSDVDAEVEEALPLEQALRALTHWHNLKRYADKIGADQGMLEKEQDFFVKELQKMEWEDEPMASKDGFEPGWDGPIQVNAW